MFGVSLYHFRTVPVDQQPPHDPVPRLTRNPRGRRDPRPRSMGTSSQLFERGCVGEDSADEVGYGDMRISIRDGLAVEIDRVGFFVEHPALPPGYFDALHEHLDGLGSSRS